MIRVVGRKDLSAGEGGGFRVPPANRWVAVPSGKSRKQLVTGLQVLDAKQPGVLTDELRIESGEVGGTDLRCCRCCPAAARRQSGALVLQFPKSLGSKVEQLAPERLGCVGIPPGEEASQGIQGLLPGDVAAVLPLPQRMLGRAHRRRQGKTLDGTPEPRLSQLHKAAGQGPTA